LRDRLKHLEINAYIFQYDNAAALKEELTAVLDGIALSLEETRTEVERLSAKGNSALEEIATLDKKAEITREQILSLSLGLERLSGEKKLIQEKLNLLSSQNNDVQTEINLMTTQLENDREAQHAAKNLHTELLVEAKALQVELDAAAAEYATRVEELAAFDQDCHDNQSQLVTRMTNITENKSAMSFLLATGESIRSKIADLNARSGTLEKESEDIMLNISQNNKLLQDYTWFTGEKKAISESIAQQRIDATSQKTAKEGEISALGIKRAQLEARKKTIENLIESGEGYKYSVRKIIEGARQNTAVANNVVGVVAQLLTVPAELETAVEVALGAAAQNIVTRNEEDAKTLVNMLKRENWGRATFLPLTSVKQRGLNSDERLSLEASAGVFGIAAELVKYDKQIQPVVMGLLGRIVIMEDLDSAVQLARETSYAFKLVTLDGDVLETRGSITGGSKGANATNLWHTNNLNAIQADLQTTDEALTDATTELEIIVARLAEVTANEEAVERELNELKLNTHTATQLLSILKDEHNDRAGTIAEIDRERKDAQRTQDEITAKLKLLRDNATDGGDVDTIALNDEMAQKHEQGAELRRQTAASGETLTALKIKHAAINHEVAALADKISASVNSILLLEKGLVDKRAQLTAINKNLTLTSNMSLVEGDETLYKNNVEKLEAEKAELSSYDTRKDEIRESLGQLEIDRTNATNQLGTLQEQYFKAESNLSKIDTDIAAMQERIYEEYGLNYSSCFMFRDENFVLDGSLPEISSLKRQIAKLGAVNVNAIEDSRDCRVRYDEYKEQVTDLESARTDLQKVIKELSTEMEAKFKEDFNKINHNFQIVFKELFNGGNAKLVLTDPKDYLNSGIDIIAEPPGKKLQNISLLSGGEKALTAIAILFAILKLRPMPFCLLDEIEAALDDANVGRFAAYLQKFSSQTQFIVITHRKPTMELADNLYGVTMEEKGVSRLVSVNLAAWADNAG
jgi:chromosome segregation protein